MKIVHQIEERPVSPHDGITYESGGHESLAGPGGTHEYDVVHLFSSCKIHLTAIRCGNLVHVVMCIEGRGTLTDHEEQDHTITLHQGETVLIPATSKGVTFTPSSGMTLITSYIG